MNFVRITTVDNSYEAEFLKEDLEEADVPCVLTDVNLTNLYPNMGGFYLGSGIQVLVPKRDQVKAEEIVQRRNVIMRIVRCPNCGSAKVEHIGTDNVWGSIRLIALLLFVPIIRLKDNYHCYECRSKFRR